MRTYKVTTGSKTRWGIDFRDPRTGKRIRQVVGHSKAQAEKALARIQSDIINNKFGLSSQTDKQSFIEFLERYFKHVQTVNRPETVHQDRSRIKPLTAFLESKDISAMSQITPAIITEFQTDYMSSHSRKSWNNVLGLIKTILNRAVAWDVIAFNPLAQIKPVKIDRTFHFFKKDEISKILATAPEPLKTGVAILVYTGMRRSELWNLRTRDIDSDSGLIHVRPFGEYTTKSRKQRSIPISDELRSYLAGLKALSHSQYAYRPSIDIQWLRKSFIRLLKELSLEGTLHDLRHTFASTMSINGAEITAISELLGHSDIKTTMMYSHLSPEAHKRAIKNISFKKGRKKAD
jgi:integrase